MYVLVLRPYRKDNIYFRTIEEREKISAVNRKSGKHFFLVDYWSLSKGNTRFHLRECTYQRETLLFALCELAQKCRSAKSDQRHRSFFFPFFFFCCMNNIIPSLFP